MELVSGKVLGVSDRANYFIENLKFNLSPLFVLDILVVAILLYWVYIFLKETRAMRILYGIVFLFALLALGRLLNLILLNWILRSLMTMLIVAIPVVFQPEMRAALEKLGRSKLLGELALTREDFSKIADEIVSAVYEMSKQKIGGLIVIKRQTGLREYIDNGLNINAIVSAKMILSIFFPKSPLHDGAVIISGDRIKSAGSVLPVTSSFTGGNIGTRHKAGIGITENSDAFSVIVSEETGSVSLAVGGKLEAKVTEERLRSKMMSLMRSNLRK